ncbi:MAG TPA: D-aminoacylase [Chthonomonadaceae bacterium]|nr:D-aminoacylase [Chthonomonadaceae bacterium]
MYDVLITGARVVDGTGNPWFAGDVALSAERIAAIAPPGSIPRTAAAEVVEATGKVVCPGFIDIQSHSLGPFMTDGRAISKVTQGVTTEIMGELWTPTPLGGRRQEPSGWSSLPPEIEQRVRQWRRFRDWLDFLTERGVSVNFGSFVGGATVREYAKGWDSGDPTPEELAEMCRITAEAMEEGAFGVATALIYPPNSYSPDAELIALARVTAEYGGLYITHIRSEGDRLLESIEETIELARQAQAAVEVYHLKATGKPNWWKMPAVIARIDAARAEGIDIAADMYPYVASGTGLTVLIPDWASEGGRLFENLRDPETRARIRTEMEVGAMEGLASVRERRRDYVVPLGFLQSENRLYIGKNLEEIAAMRGQDWIDTTIDLLLSEQQRIGTVFFSMSEENLRLQLRQPWIKISTDAGGIAPEGQTNPCHPRAYGTYTRVLGKYVREEKVLPLEDAIRKITSSVAARLCLRDRGLLQAGCFADVVVFAPDTVGDRATFTDSHRLSVGIEEVWVNGQRVLREGRHTGALPGRAVYGPGRKS